MTLDIFISVQVYSFRFVSQNTEINKTENRSKYTNLVFFVVQNPQRTIATEPLVIESSNF